MDSLSDKLIEPKSVTDEVMKYLREQLLVGNGFPPGAFIREGDVADLLHVSKSPVREALRQLESYGLVKTLPRRGAMVLGFTPLEMDEIYDDRLILEIKIYKYIIKNKLLTDEHYQWLKNCINRFYSIHEVFVKDKARGQLEFFDLDCQFHFYIHELSGLTWTSGLLKRTYLRLYQIIARHIAHGDLENLVQIHGKLLEDLKNGDIDSLYSNRVESYVVGKYGLKGMERKDDLEMENSD